MRTKDAAPAPIDARFAQLAGLHAELIYKLSGFIDAVDNDDRRRRALDGRAELAELVDEYMSSANGSNDTKLTLPPSTSNIILVEHVQWSLPAGATGTLQLGNRVIPNLPAGFQSLGVKIPLFPTDVRTLTSSAAGALYLELTGKQLSPVSILR